VNLLPLAKELRRGWSFFSFIAVEDGEVEVANGLMLRVGMAGLLEVVCRAIL
jgi:hypothetical protein